jgi:cytidylate kinase
MQPTDAERIEAMAVLFISRGTVSGVQILIDRLCKLTGFKCLSREDLVKEVSRYGDWATEAVNHLSKATSAYEHFSRIRRPYIVLMRQALLEKIREDNVVYYGFSGHLLVPRLKHFVRVRINAPLSLRVPMTMERLKCDEENAREYIRNSDDHQVRWARFVYGRDIRDPALYDMNINMGHLTVEVVCRILRHILLEKDLQASSELKAQVEQLYLAASIEAALIIDPRTRELEIDANVENDSIHLNGPYLEDSNLEVVMGIARSVDGIAKVEYSPGYASQYRLEEHEEKYRSQLPV